ncbi:cysteine-rich receptor-like protein kinase 8 [Tanacetum coccineum]
MRIITGEFVEPNRDSELRALWERNNDMLISWILNTVSEQIGNNLNFINSASKLWLELQEHYAQIDGHRIYQLSNDIVQLKQENCTVEVYYHKLKGLWDEFYALEAPYLCLCLCTCANERITILLTQPLPTAAKAYTMVRQEEKQREGIAPKSVTAIILNNYKFNTPNNSNNQRNTVPNTQNSRFTSQRPIQNSYERRSNFRKGVYYGNCGKEGHLQEECYKIVGYPVGHPLHEKIQPTKQFKPRQDYKRTVNMVVGQDESNKASTSGQNNAPTDTHVSARMDQLQNQINQVLQMLQSQQNTPHGIFSSHSTRLPKFVATLITCLTIAWIIDSGATDHISTTLKIMHNIYKCKTPITVTLPNGQNVKVTTIGSVTINKYITLHNVFYILTFTYNIISVSKLLQGTTISLILTASLCIFQDQNRRIAHGSLCDGLYFFSSPFTPSTTTPTILHNSSKPHL